MKELKIRYGLGKIDKETYELAFEHLNEQILNAGKELNNGKLKISNLDSLLKKSVQKLSNLSKIWGSGNLEDKRALQKTLFPEGIYYDVKNNQYLTENTNTFVELVACISNEYETKKKEDPSTFDEKSSSVPESRLELPTFGL